MFDLWMQICLNDIKKVTAELYFLGQFDLNPKRISKILTRSSKLFKEWGFFHDEIVLNKSEALNRTAVSKTERLRLLRQLVKSNRHSNKQITVEQYRLALNYQVSVRQAQRDLKASA
jgi:hypothetical protein